MLSPKTCAVVKATIWPLLRAATCVAESASTLAVVRTAKSSVSKVTICAVVSA